MRRFRKEFGPKKVRIMRERLILVSQGLKISINRHPPSTFMAFELTHFAVAKFCQLCYNDNHSI